MSDSNNANAGSGPVADDIAGSSTAQSDTGDSQTQMIPKARFDEVNNRMKAAEDKLSRVDDMESKLNSIQSAFSPQESKEQIPDMYENPQAYAQWIQQNTINQIDARTKAETDARQAENSRLDGQLSQLKEKHGEVDSEAVQQHALKYNMRTPDGKGIDLEKAYENMLESGKVTPGAKARVEAAPLGSSQTTRNPATNISQKDLSNMSRGSGFSQFVASQYD